MNAFGYDEHDEEYENLLKLNEVTLSCKKEEILKIADFFNKMKDEIESENTFDSDHWHYRDFNKGWTEDESDLIIYVNENSDK